MQKTVIFDMKDTIFQTLDQSQLNQKLIKSEKSHFLAIQSLPYAIEVFLSFFNNGYKIAIISSSDVQSSRDRLQYLLSLHQVDEENQRQIFKEIDILSMQYFGSKDDVVAWQSAMSPYQNIEYIFEDGETKIQAAAQAAANLGHKPQLFTSIEEFALKN